jgi:hypothetical protein
MRAHRPEGFLEKLVVPLKLSGRFPSFLRRYGFATKMFEIWLFDFTASPGPSIREGKKYMAFSK